ncbi:helix-turn-helix domain-containing protein [Chitinophaga sp. OAE865]|uniref:helix-turn-helix domain-containing protein n=1 Tax=Chitinophaga sp. OAE865 TaxID=2817898 RepID=UPI001AE8BC55
MWFPFDPDQFWQRVRIIIREEVPNAERSRPAEPLYETPDLTYKPLFKLAEVCKLFQVTKPTIYEWIRRGRLKRHKIKSRVFFLWNDIQQLLQPEQDSRD